MQATQPPTMHHTTLRHCSALHLPHSIHLSATVIMKKYIKPTPVFHDSPLPLMTNTISGSNMPWEAKKQYIPPYIDFSEIEEEELMQGASATGYDMPAEGEWDAKSSTFSFEESPFEELSFNQEYYIE